MRLLRSPLRAFLGNHQTWDNCEMIRIVQSLSCVYFITGLILTRAFIDGQPSHVLEASGMVRSTLTVRCSESAINIQTAIQARIQWWVVGVSSLTIHPHPLKSSFLFQCLGHILARLNLFLTWKACYSQIFPELDSI